MIYLNKAKEVDVWQDSFQADPDHDVYVGPQVPEGEVWTLTTMYFWAGDSRADAMMMGILRDKVGVPLKSSRGVIQGDALDWSGRVELAAGTRLIYQATGAPQDAQFLVAATWTVLNTTGPHTVKAKAKPSDDTQESEDS